VDITRILESLKLSPKYLFAVFAAGVFLLFAPLRFQVGLVEFRQRFLPYIGGVTLISATLLLTHGVAALFDSLKRKRAARKELKSFQERLHSLTPAEKEALRPYIREEVNTRTFVINDGVAGGLVGKGILYRSSNTALFMYFPYNLQTWARDYLKEHPEWLD
jgi:hypothetical protein